MIEMINQNPKGGALGTIITFLIGILPEVSPETQNLITFYFQIVAFSVTIIVGIMTMASMIRKAREKKTQKVNR